MTHRGYAVLTINQASQWGEQLDGAYLTLEEARDIAVNMAVETAHVHRRDRHVVCELVEVED